MSRPASARPRVSVAVPVNLDRAFDYSLPKDMARPEAGERVLVPFGARVLVGVVRPSDVKAAGAQDEAEAKKMRPILARLDAGSGPTLGPDLVALCEWMSSYYMAPVGEAYRTALPGLLSNADARVASVSEAGRAKLRAHREGPLLAGTEAPSPEQGRVLAAIDDAGGQLPASKATKLEPPIPSILLRLEELAGLGWVEWAWPDAGDIETRTETHFRRTALLRGRDVDEPALRAVIGRSKQRRALLDALEASGDAEGWVAISDLRGAFPRVRELIKALIEGELVVAEERPRELDPFAAGAPTPTEEMAATADQASALAELGLALGRGDFASYLLHGITGSGKTEVYLQLIARALREDAEAGAIVLVPEIALTPQLSDRFRARFGDEVAVLHSALTPRQRLDAWDQIARGLRRIVIGPRSAIFAPLPRVRVVVVDEEHDGSFKQEEGLRYNARDLALMRGQQQGAVVVLGSATPSLESYARAKEGKHGYLRLVTRPTPRPLPEVELLDLAQHRPDPETMLSAKLRQAVLTTVEAGEQAILFLNRRGYTTSMTCIDCGAMQQCPDCSAPSMTYHLERNRLMCHLCGHIEASPRKCLACGAEALVHGRGGTERVEVALQGALPGVRVARLDRDTSRGRALLETLRAFRAREADVLVGTQMLSKGHDFPGVTLVGILQGDHGLGLPDPRAAEKTFALLTQVAGRAGRGERPGRVLIQAWAVTHPALVHARDHDYEGFATAELASREELHNPPYGHLVLVRASGHDAAGVRARIEDFATRARRAKAALLEIDPAAEALSLLGPVPAPIERINRRSRWQLLMRAPTRGPLRRLLHALRPALGVEGRGAKQTSLSIDVDPQSLL